MRNGETQHLEARSASKGNRADITPAHIRSLALQASRTFPHLRIGLVAHVPIAHGSQSRGTRL